ncbi:hypothetical protein N9M26_01175 [Alphaproteobacteria bacterium]|nr:hypothetical protein [Alphaproteobacteria bacterium]
MSYIGRGTESISNVEVLDNLTFNGSASYTLQKSSVNFVPSSANNLLISISGVVQQGNFSVSGSTITFDTTVSASDTCDWILHYGTGLITTVADGAITEAKLGSNAVTTAKINNGAITSAKLDSGLALGKIGQVVTTTFTGTESATSKVSSGSFTDSSIYASLTPSSTSSKIMVMATVNTGSSDGSNGGHVGRFVQIIGATTTPVFIGDASGIKIQTSSGRGNEAQGAYTILTNSFNFLLTPSTTSAVTVKYQFGIRGGGSGTAYINRVGTESDSTEFQRTASAITLMEVLA